MKEDVRRPEAANPKTNHFLARLDLEDYDALLFGTTIVSLKLGRKMMRQDERAEAVYFPLTCMVSLLVTIDGKAQMEMATIGREGVVGASEALQAQGAIGLNLVQIPGTAVRVDATAFRKVLQNRPRLLALFQEHLYALLRQVLYGAACNRLMTHDRAGMDTFPLTQEFLSHMLGVRRATVNVATGMLKKAGFIRYLRGKLTIVDRPGLESASCECYQAIVRVYDSIRTSHPKQ